MVGFRHPDPAPHTRVRSCGDRVFHVRCALLCSPRLPVLFIPRNAFGARLCQCIYSQASVSAISVLVNSPTESISNPKINTGIPQEILQDRFQTTAVK